MAYYLLFYNFVDGFMERRAAFRTEHLARVNAAHAAGEIVLAGAYGDPPSGGTLVFRVDALEAVRAFAQDDPYVRNGLVREWSVEPWHVVVGEDG
jgi:uncharacterized protein YciI